GIFVVLFVLEILVSVAARSPNRSLARPTGARPRVAVLLPAHNEATGLLPTVGDIKAQLRPGDRLLVVADNCNDDTAAIAAAAGAEVVERNNAEKIGKGYALDWGLQQLRYDPPEMVVMIDADCRLSADAIEHLITNVAKTGRPTQALYFMTAPDPSPINHQIA